MLQVTQENLRAIQGYVIKKWPEKRVSCQQNPDANHKHRFIMISAPIDEHIVHYEYNYSNERFELHFEGEYTDFNYGLYKYLRDNADTSTGDYRWHNWWNMKQGRLSYEYNISNLLDLADAIDQMIPYVDGLINEYLKSLGMVDDGYSTEKPEEVLSDIDVQKFAIFSKEESIPIADTMKVRELMPAVKYIKELPFDNFIIPDYQRPYKWNPKHVNQLINDILAFHEKKEYRLGTLVLHDNNIVDGQQRIVTLSLLFYVLYDKLMSNTTQEIPYNGFLKKISIFWQRITFDNPISIAHVRENLVCIKERKEDFDVELLTFLLEKCRFVVVRLPKIAEAFQFFDSQNARGKDLEPHDLLKAFHLREIPKLDERDKQNITHWEDENPQSLIHLFLAMYRVNRWSKAYSGEKFTKDDIDVFKGISLNSKRYPFYLQQVICHFFINDYVENKARMIDRVNMDYPFQLDQVCINGSRFFDMIRYYGILFEKIRKEGSYSNFGTQEHSPYQVIHCLNTYANRNRKGDIYVRELFDCMLFYYVDKFGFEEIDKVIWKLFREAYRLRLIHYSVKLATIDNFAQYERVFKLIRDAQTPFDVINMPTPQLNRLASNVDESNDQLLKLFKQ